MRIDGSIRIREHQQKDEYLQNFGDTARKAV